MPKVGPKLRAKYAAEHRHARDRLLAVYAGATDAEVAEGRAWYDTAREIAANLASPADGIDTERAAAIIAVLSPQVRWKENVESARLVIGATLAGRVRMPPGVRAYPSNVRKAQAIVRGAEIGLGPGDGLGGEAPKVRNFWRAIVGDSDAVTLDVWAMRAALVRRDIASYTWAKVPTPKRAFYPRAVGWYRDAAERCGETPRDFQAIIWTAIRGVERHRADIAAARESNLLI